MNDAQTILKEHVLKMPEPIRNAFFATDIQGPIKEISTKHGLMLDQTTALENETVYVMIGLASGEDFVDNLVKEVEVSTTEAIEIAREIEETVFNELRHHIQEETVSNEGEGGPENRDEILREIEKPSRRPSIPSNKTPEAQKPKDRITIEEIRAMHKRETASEPQRARTIPSDQSGEAPKSLAESRLSETLSNPHKKINKEEERKESIKKNYPGGEDPYREPIE